MALINADTKRWEELLRFKTSLNTADPVHSQRADDPSHSAPVNGHPAPAASPDHALQRPSAPNAPQAEDQPHSPVDSPSPSSITSAPGHSTTTAADAATSLPAEATGGPSDQSAAPHQLAQDPPKVTPQPAQDQPAAVSQLVQHQRRLSDAECDEIANLYRDGVLVKEICQRFGIGKQRVRNICKRRGIKPRTRGMSEQQKRQTEQLYAEGLSTYIIATRLDVSDDVVWRYLRSIGTTMRSPGRPRGARRR